MTLNKTSQYALRKLAYKLSLQVKDGDMDFAAATDVFRFMWRSLK